MADTGMDREGYKRQNNSNNNTFTQRGGNGRKCSSENEVLVATALQLPELQTLAHFILTTTGEVGGQSLPFGVEETVQKNYRTYHLTHRETRAWWQLS